MPKLSIIVPIYKKKDEISNFFKNLVSQKSNDFEVIIVVDANKEEELQAVMPWIEKLGKKSRLVFNTKRRGFSQAISTAVKIARGEYMLILCISDKIQNQTGVTNIIFEIEKSNKPDILEFPLQFRGLVHWDITRKIEGPEAMKISERPEFVAMTMPVIFNKVFNRNKFLEAIQIKPFKQMNTRFIFEILYTMLLTDDDLTFAISKKELIQNYISKSTTQFNPIGLVKQWKSIFSLSSFHNNKLGSELLYASIFHQKILMNKFTIALKEKIMIDKYWIWLKNLYEIKVNEISNNAYIMKNTRESILLKDLKSQAELKKVMKEF